MRVAPVLPEHLSPIASQAEPTVAAWPVLQTVKRKPTRADGKGMRLAQAVVLGVIGFLLGGAGVAIVCVALVLPVLLLALSLARPDRGTATRYRVDASR